MVLNKEIEERIDHWIDAHVEEYLTDLAKLIAVPSVANPGVAPGEFPFGEKSAEVLKTAKVLAESYGFTVENRDNFCLVTKVGSGEEKMGIFGHLDVVPVGADWSYPPFEMTREGDLVIGRGVMDDKGPLWSSVFAVRCLKELDLLPNRAIEIFMGGDEECGMEDVKHYKETSEVLPVVSFTPDADYPICHGEKGIMRFMLNIPNENSGVVSFIGGTVRNVVADHAELTLSGVCPKALSEKLAGKPGIEVLPDGDNAKIIATGKAVHASRPDNGTNAIALAANAALDSGLLGEEAKKVLSFVSLVLSDCHGKAIGVPLKDEPSGALTHVGGVIKTAENKLILSIDIRYPVTCDGDDVIRAITDVVTPYGVTIDDFTDSKPLYIPVDSELVKTCMDTIDGIFHRDDWKPYTMGGGTYARNLPNAYALGPEDPAFMPFGPFRGGVHQDDEIAPISTFVKTMKLYARLLLRVDDLKF